MKVSTYSKDEVDYIKTAYTRGDYVRDIAEHLDRALDSVNAKIRSLYTKGEVPKRNISRGYRKL